MGILKVRCQAGKDPPYAVRSGQSHTHQISQLVGNDQYADCRQEADQYRIGNIAADLRDLEQTEQELEHTGQDSHSQHKFKIVRSVDVGQQDAGSDQRGGVGGTGDQKGITAEDRPEDGWDDGGIKPIKGVDPGNSRVRHGLGDHNHSNG